MARELRDDELDRLLHAAVGPTPAEDQAVFDDVWTRVSSALDQPDLGQGMTGVAAIDQGRTRVLLRCAESARRRKRARRLATAALAVAVASSGTAAAADYISARTGQTLSGWEVGAGGSGEVIDHGGDDLGAVVAAETADISFPVGYEAQRVFALNVYAPAEGGSATTRSHLRSSIAGAAVCSWADTWVASNRSGDAATQDAAAAQLQSSVAWEPFLTFASDHQEPAPADSTTPGDSYRWWLRPLAEAAAAGAREQVLDLVAESHACTYQLIPVIDGDPDYPEAGVR